MERCFILRENINQIQKINVAGSNHPCTSSKLHFKTDKRILCKNLNYFVWRNGSGSSSTIV